MLSLVELDPVVLEEKMFKFVNVFPLFTYYFPLKKGMALQLNKVESRSPKEALCQSLVEIGLVDVNVSSL